MLFKYNHSDIKFEPVSKFRYLDVRVTLILALMLSLIAATVTDSTRNSQQDVVYEDRVLLLEEIYAFSEAKLIEQIARLNFRHPHIVLAQAKLESGNYSSAIFRENNNLFGMKKATVRLNLATTSNKGHAYYDTWQDSVLDYALYTATYLNSLKTEEQYYNYLAQNYAEDTMYVYKVKQIVEAQNLKKLF
jgi:uncharacterized FlgJ-related protein